MENASGYNFIIPTFTDVGAGTATYDLQSIKLINAPGDGLTDGIIGYDPYGALTEVDYYWQTVDGALVEIEKDGWYYGTMGEDLVTDVTLPLGTGLYLSLGTEGAQVQYAGQVYQESFTTAELPVGYNMVGNATPVPVDIQDVKLVDAPGDGLTDGIIGYDEYAALTEDDWYWQTVDGALVEIDKDGWYLGTMGEELAECTLMPGQGFFLSLGSEGVKVQFPSPIVK